MAITIDDLAPQVGSAFAALTQRGPVRLELVQAQERPRGGLPPRFATPLSLLLRAPEGVTLVQENYTLQHPVLGEHTWMLVPVLGADGTPCYEVILSQLSDAR